MSQRIALDPALGLTPTELAAAWNANPVTAAYGKAAVEAQPSKSLDLAEMGFMVVSSMAIGLLTNYIYDLIKGAFADKAAPPITIHPIDQPDGSQIIIVVVQRER
ncbi:MAG: hypothetical protein R3C14_34665 [Caldilineaceae bacterium]